MTPEEKATFLRLLAHRIETGQFGKINALTDAGVLRQLAREFDQIAKAAEGDKEHDA